MKGDTLLTLCSKVEVMHPFKILVIMTMVIKLMVMIIIIVVMLNMMLKMVIMNMMVTVL